jgi:DNA-directed RNA polymerase specialized sigma24 family protein
VREALFEQAYPLARRAVQVRAASGAMRAGDREDFEQEALLGLWIALRRYDPSRASLRTFVERVTDNRFASLMRRRRSSLVVERLDGHWFATPDGIPAVQFQVDFERILAPSLMPTARWRYCWSITGPPRSAGCSASPGLPCTPAWRGCAERS